MAFSTFMPSPSMIFFGFGSGAAILQVGLKRVYQISTQVKPALAAISSSLIKPVSCPLMVLMFNEYLKAGVDFLVAAIANAGVFNKEAPAV